MTREERITRKNRAVGHRTSIDHPLQGPMGAFLRGHFLQGHSNRVICPGGASYCIILYLPSHPPMSLLELPCPDLSGSALAETGWYVTLCRFPEWRCQSHRSRGREEGRVRIRRLELTGRADPSGFAQRWDHRWHLRLIRISSQIWDNPKSGDELIAKSPGYCFCLTSQYFEWRDKNDERFCLSS